MLRKILHVRTMALVSLLTGALAVPGSTATVPSTTDLDATPPPRRVDTPASPSLWGQPVAPATVEVKAAAKPAEPDHATSANPLWAIPLATLTATRERPIFSPSRRPPPPAVAPAPVVAAPPPKTVRVERPQLALVGTIESSEQSFGIFVDQTTKAALRLRLGEDYQGWRLHAVAPRNVTLAHDAQTEVLSLPSPDLIATQQASVHAQSDVKISESRRARGQAH